MTKPTQAARDAAEAFFPPARWKEAAIADLAQAFAKFEREILARTAPDNADSRGGDALRALTTIKAIIGNVDHSKGNGPNAAEMRGGMLNDIRTLCERALSTQQDSRGGDALQLIAGYANYEAISDDRWEQGKAAGYRELGAIAAAAQQDNPAASEGVTDALDGALAAALDELDRECRCASARGEDGKRVGLAVLRKHFGGALILQRNEFAPLTNSALRARLAHSGDTAKGMGCDTCRRVNPVWFAPSPLWNLVMGGPDATDDPGGFLCPICFIEKAEAQGIMPEGGAWLLTNNDTAKGDEVETLHAMLHESLYHLRLDDGAKLFHEKVMALRKARDALSQAGEGK